MLSTKRARAVVASSIAASFTVALVAGIAGASGAHAVGVPVAMVQSSATQTAAVSDITAERAYVATHRASSAVIKANVAKAHASADAALRAKVVKIALSRKGMAYSAGSAGPTAFDCSGFTNWVWGQAGRAIERTSYDQFDTLKPVSRAQARPGDLVFFFGDGTNHVAMYLGHNMMIHAANYDSGVIITSLSDGWYSERISGFRSVA